MRIVFLRDRGQIDLGELGTRVISSRFYLAQLRAYPLRSLLRALNGHAADLESRRHQRRLSRHVLPATIPFQIDPEVASLSGEWLAIIRTAALLLTNHDCRS